MAIRGHAGGREVRTAPEERPRLLRPELVCRKQTTPHASEGSREELALPKTVSAAIQLHLNGDRETKSWLPAVVQVITIVIVDVHIVILVPVLPPLLRPRVNQEERKAAVVETRVPVVHDGARLYPERVLITEIHTEAILGDVIAAVASALHPSAMLAIPLAGAAALL